MRLLDKLVPLFEEAWEKVGVGDAVTWELAPFFTDQNGIIVMAMACCASPVVGSVLMTNSHLPDPARMDAERALEVVRFLNDQLSLQASEVLRTGQADGPVLLQQPKH